jgi:hypothetical protein
LLKSLPSVSTRVATSMTHCARTPLDRGRKRFTHDPWWGTKPPPPNLGLTQTTPDDWRPVKPWPLAVSVPHIEPSPMVQIGPQSGTIPAQMTQQRHTNGRRLPAPWPSRTGSGRESAWCSASASSVIWEASPSSSQTTTSARRIALPTVTPTPGFGDGLARPARSLMTVGTPPVACGKLTRTLKLPSPDPVNVVVAVLWSRRSVYVSVPLKKNTLGATTAAVAVRLPSGAVPGVRLRKPQVVNGDHNPSPRASMSHNIARTRDRCLEWHPRNRALGLEQQHASVCNRGTRNRRLN